MKKNYINPEMQIVKLAYRNVLLTASTENLGVEAKEETVGFGREFDFTEE